VAGYQPRLGSARLSHPEEYAQIINELKAAGVEIDYRAGSLAYSPAKGGPGKMVLDPDASIGALRHEYQHFLDIQAAEFPGLGAYYLRFARNSGRFGESARDVFIQVGW
jgi:hypothetical protein